MIRTRQSAQGSTGEDSAKTLSAFRAFCRELWFIPLIAIVIAILILVIERAQARILTKFVSSFIYAMLIGFPSALTLNWVGFRYSDRFPRLVFLIHTAVLMVMAAAGSAVGAFLLSHTGVLAADDTFGRELRSALPLSLVITLVVGLSITSYETLRHRLQDATLRLRTQQVEQERANKLLAEARLSSLEARIHPHFLFNTLNSISALIPTDPKRAEDTVGKLASLLRFAISANQASLVPLAQELKVVRDYLDIQATRFGPRLQYEICVSGECERVKIPPLAVQNLVENAIKHVVSERGDPALITISALTGAEFCEVRVTDDGPGFSLAEVSPDHGLGNLMGRLELLFGEGAGLNVSRAEEKTVVSLRVPVERVP